MTEKTGSITGHSNATLSDRYAMRYDAVTSDASPCASVEVALWNPANTASDSGVFHMNVKRRLDVSQRLAGSFPEFLLKDLERLTD